jgi:hypothetical protein
MGQPSGCERKAVAYTEPGFEAVKRGGRFDDECL